MKNQCSLVSVTTYETEVECFEALYKKLNKKIMKLEEELYNKDSPWWEEVSVFFGLFKKKVFNKDRFKAHMGMVSDWAFPFDSYFEEKIVIYSNENLDNLHKLIRLMKAGNELYLDSDLAEIYRVVKGLIGDGEYHDW